MTSTYFAQLIELPATKQVGERVEFQVRRLVWLQVDRRVRDRVDPDWIKCGFNLKIDLNDLFRTVDQATSK